MIAPLSMTLRRLFDLHMADEPLAANTRQLRRYQLKRWEELTGDPPVSAITTATLDELRKNRLAIGHSPESIEGDISFVIHALHVAFDKGLIERMPKRGKRLSGQKRRTGRISLPDFDRFLSAISTARLSVPRKGPERPPALWLAFFATPFFAALRKGDLVGLEWEQFGSEFLERRQNKTGELVRVPIHPVWKRLLSALPNAWTKGRVFAGISYKTIHRDLHAILRASGLKGVTPQAIRVLSARSYERAHPGAGRLILGRPLPGADSYYFDVPEILQMASDKLRLPPSLLLPEERQSLANRETLMLGAFRGLRPKDQDTAVRMVLGLSAVRGEDDAA